jgi:hypothetical protein
MAGMTMTPTPNARATVDLLLGFGVLGGRIRNVGPDLCPSGH